MLSATFLHAAGLQLRKADRKPTSDRPSAADGISPTGSHVASSRGSLRSSTHSTGKLQTRPTRVSRRFVPAIMPAASRSKPKLLRLFLPMNGDRSIHESMSTIAIR